ncbi:MAG: tetraacyldisaccharide 4-kinase [Moraxellaceae bacterium]|nr:tetraacyldisaccharide 4-kinase [Moraxellaceae bacterium]
MSDVLARAWYRGHPALWLLAPLAVVYALLLTLRRALYRAGLLGVSHFGVPVIVVGNITVGGTGKTPLTLALIERLRAAGYRPGVVSRGYGGKARYPFLLGESSTPAEAGDEPAMMFRRSGVPLVVDPIRSRAVRHLLQNSDCNVVLCDDGLQHLALARDIEIAVVDGARGFGNRWLLPAGPLREPVRRLRTVDHVVVNGDGDPWPGAYPMRLVPGAWLPVGEGEASLPAAGSRVHAVAGIGNPERFFDQLQAQGFSVIPHAFPDHHAYATADFSFADGLPVVMTEKDMVKCRELALRNCWYVPVSAALPEPFYEALLAELRAATKENRNAG